MHELISNSFRYGLCGQLYRIDQQCIVGLGTRKNTAWWSVKHAPETVPSKVKLSLLGDPGVRGELFEEVKQSAPVCASCASRWTPPGFVEEKSNDRQSEKRKKEKTRERKRKKNLCGRPCLLRDSARDIPRLPYLHICGPWFAPLQVFSAF